MNATSIGRATRPRRDPRTTVTVAAWYAQEVRAGHVSMANTNAVVTTLRGHVEALLTVIEDQHLCAPEPTTEQSRRRDELLAEVPPSQRAEGAPDIDSATAVAVTLSRLPGDVATIVTHWLRAAKTEATDAN